MSKRPPDSPSSISASGVAVAYRPSQAATRFIHVMGTQKPLFKSGYSLGWYMCIYMCIIAYRPIYLSHIYANIRQSFLRLQWCICSTMQRPTGPRQPRTSRAAWPVTYIALPGGWGTWNKQRASAMSSIDFPPQDAILRLQEPSKCPKSSKSSIIRYH